MWNSVDKHTQKSFTSVIHGKYSHEETVATASFASNYVIVRDLAEAQYLCDYILKGGDKAEFMKKFAKATSKGFDPETMLDKVRLACVCGCGCGCACRQAGSATASFPPDASQPGSRPGPPCSFALHPWASSHMRACA